MKPVLPVRPAQRRGFTLIELLVVVTIIALLAAGAYGAYSIMIERGKKAAASSACVAVINAISNFETDYDRLPLPTSAQKGTDVATDTSAEEGLITVLKGADKTQNPKSTDYLGEIKDAKALSTQAETKRVDGIYRESDEMISLWDPWGSVYEVSLDLDGDRKVANPDQSDPSNAAPELHKTVIIYSPGKDLAVDEWKDNVTSWNQ